MTDEDTATPRPVSGLCGQAVRGEYGKGSKSARMAVFLETDAGRYILRRKTGPVFGNAALEQYVGHAIDCDGYIVGTTLLAEKIRIVK